MADAPVLSVRGLVHRYGHVQALDGLDLEVGRGAWALLGPNGSGKTTLIRLALGLVRATEGSLQVLGIDPRTRGTEVRRRIGYMPEGPALLPGLSGVQLATLAARLAGLPDERARRGAHLALDAVELGEARYRAAEGYSTGMRQRLKLAAALAHDPAVLVLDEPTNGLDPEGRDAMLDLIRTLTREQGRSLLLSSHILPEVRRVCDRTAVLSRGRAVHIGPIEELRVDLGGVVLEPLDDAAPLARALRKAGYEVEERNGQLVVTGDVDLPRVLKVAGRAGVGIRAARPHHRAAHDVLVELMEVPA